MVVAALFTGVERWRHPKCLSAEKRADGAECARNGRSSGLRKGRTVTRDGVGEPGGRQADKVSPSQQDRQCANSHEAPVADTFTDGKANGGCQGLGEGKREVGVSPGRSSSSAG